MNKYAIVVSPHELNIDVGHNAKLNATVTDREPDGVGEKVDADVVFESNAEKVATVTRSGGLVRGISPGTAKITVTYSGVHPEDAAATAECTVEVRAG